jgi:hypothetical protein
MLHCVENRRLEFLRTTGAAGTTSFLTKRGLQMLEVDEDFCRFLKSGFPTRLHVPRESTEA